MKSQKPRQGTIRQNSQSPAVRIASLSSRLKQLVLIQQVIEHEGGQALLNVLGGMIAQKRIARDNLNWDDKPEAFIAFKEKASYATGYIQGAEYTKNFLNMVPLEVADLKKQISEIEKEVKGKRRRAAK